MSSFHSIIFDSEKLAWRLPEDKIYKTLSAIDLALKAEETSLIQLQKLMGRLNDICLMCPFLNGFKRNLNDDLGELQRSQGKIRLSAQSKSDLMIWAGFLLDEEEWCPISPRPSGPPSIQKRIFVRRGGRVLLEGQDRLWDSRVFRERWNYICEATILAG